MLNIYMNDYSAFYQSLQKPFFAPPEWVFGVAWGIIYPLIAIAFIYFLFLLWKKEVPPTLLWVLLLNLAANILFTPILFGFKDLIFATVDILIVLVTLAYFEYKIFSSSKIIFALLLPYLLWGSFATVLQISITLLN